VRKPKSTVDDRLRLTIQKPEGAVVGRIDSVTETGVMALLNGELSQDVRYPFTLHLNGGTVGGEVEDAGSIGDLRRLRFVALTGSDMRLLEPYFSLDQ
jgi:hypothetical protein